MILIVPKSHAAAGFHGVRHYTNSDITSAYCTQWLMLGYCWAKQPINELHQATRHDTAHSPGGRECIGLVVPPSSPLASSSYTHVRSSL
jgi:hypothetical protein